MLTVLLMMLALFLNSALAAQVSDLNAADVAVSDNSEKTLQQALPQAFGQVLLKMSGNATIMTVPAIQNAVPHINNYIVSYNYDGPIVHVVFDTKAIKQLLQTAGQALWGPERPLTLVWVLVPEAVQPEVLSADSSDALVNTIKQQTTLRGVPIIFPAMDLQDETYVAQTDSALPTAQQLQSIAQRYGVSCILTGAVVTDSNGEMGGQWKLFLNGTPYEWQTTASSVAQVVINGVDRAADLMASQLAVLDSKNRQRIVTMQVNGVNNLNDYVHVIAELKKLTPVSEVAVSDMGANTVLLKIKTVGGTDELVNALKSASHFVAEAAPAGSVPDAVELFYRWSEEVNPLGNTDNTNNSNNS